MEVARMLLFLNIFLATSSVGEATTASFPSKPLRLKPMEKLILGFAEESLAIELQGENQTPVSRIFVNHIKNEIVSGVFQSNGTVCGANEHVLPNGTMRAGKNIAHIWYREQTLFYKINKYSGTGDMKAVCVDGDSGCNGYDSPLSEGNINQLRLFQNLTKKINPIFKLICKQN